MSQHHNAKHALSRREQVHTSVAGDGNSAQAKRAHVACLPLACANEACVKKHMYGTLSAQRAACGALFQKWQDCFDLEMRRPDSTAP